VAFKTAAAPAFAAALVTGFLLGSPAHAAEDQKMERWLAENLARGVENYEYYHAHPELSLEEAQTATRIAQQIRDAGYRVTTGIGGHGVVGILENGPGPNLMIRADTDGLPVEEATDLPYASQVTIMQDDGTSTGVMHACGHDMHIASLIETGRYLAEFRDDWSGTLILLFQPAEELGRGALMMMADGLFEKFPRPDYTIALHVESDMAAGTVGYTPGWSGANVDSVDITIYGRGGHGARPHTTVDPITISAYLVTQLQTLVSRRVDPLDPAVVTVGSIHGGHKNNVIPDEVHLQLTVRSYSDAVRTTLIEGIRQMTADTCRSFLCPQEPEVRIKTDYTPAVYNDPALVARTANLFRNLFGAANVFERRPSMGGDDFGRFSRVLGVPSVYFRLGSVDPVIHSRFEEADGTGVAPLPSLHSSHYAPLAEPTLRTGVRAMTALALELLGEER
jgi:amidohydrolase